MKAVINPHNLSNTNIDEIIVNDSVITDKSIIVNKFNEYFVNIGQTLAANIPPVPGDVTSYMLNNYPNSMCADNTNINAISNIIASLKSGNRKGNDGVSSALIKNLPTEIAIPLALIFNKSIAYGQFPTSLNIAKICPVYKCDNKLLVKNYRPISILPTFSKVFERLMYNRLLEYINKNNILFKNQYGFHEKHSTLWLF